ncbi:MAG TPA: hypothetical protein VK916_03555, partial [Gillisia sp.]|nr:hypothetical protein [Gillisia sp.]
MNYDRIFSISSTREFEKISLEVFRHQYHHVALYRKFCDLLKISPQTVTQPFQIPFLPIEFFKSHHIIAQGEKPQITFTSSGTTGAVTSKHLVSDLNWYEKSFNLAFESFYGKIQDLVILALLPSYLEREGSSLVYMVHHLIQKSGHPESGFYLDDLEKLKSTLEALEKKGKKVLLIGVSFALLDLVEAYTFNLKNTVIMETGGMKGRRREMIREELHQILKKGFGVDHIHSEYGMTELLSQAYSAGDGIFTCPPWMKMYIRDPEDALTYLPPHKTGGINVIDLANFNSCSFIATQDLGKDLGNGKTEILGRFDNSDIRGCNLMV